MSNYAFGEIEHRTFYSDKLSRIMRCKNKEICIALPENNLKEIKRRLRGSKQKQGQQIARSQIGLVFHRDPGKWCRYPSLQIDA